MRIDHGLGAIGLLLLACVLAVSLSIGVPILVASESVKLSDWLGFSGNVLAGCITLIAAWFAWRAVQQQILAQREQMLIGVLSREEERLEAERLQLNACIRFLDELQMDIVFSDAPDYRSLLEGRGLLDVEEHGIHPALERAIGIPLRGGFVNEIVDELSGLLRWIRFSIAFGNSPGISPDQSVAGRSSEELAQNQRRYARALERVKDNVKNVNMLCESLRNKEREHGRRLVLFRQRIEGNLAELERHKQSR